MRNSSLMDDRERVREAWLDFVFEVAFASGLLKLVRRLGMTPKSWVLEREARKRS